jgi:hypothetical protein
MRRFFVPLVLLACCAVAGAADQPKPADAPAVPDDFKMVVRFAPGYSDWLSWRYTITADGKVAQEIGPGGRGNPPERKEKETKVSKDEVAALFAKV